MTRRGLGRGGVLIAAVVGFTSLLHGAWIPCKAQVAQWLLASAWENTRAGGPPVKPWPWADTWSIARLSAPRQGVEQIVLAGANGATFAFGPGYLEGSGKLGEPGNATLAGHRDTHFAFLRDLAPGDELWVETPDRERFLYRVQRTQIVDKTDTAVLVGSDQAILTLITCYPFHTALPGGRLRYVVQAQRDIPAPGCPTDAAC